MRPRVPRHLVQLQEPVGSRSSDTSLTLSVHRQFEVKAKPDGTSLGLAYVFNSADFPQLNALLPLYEAIHMLSASATFTPSLGTAHKGLISMLWDAQSDEIPQPDVSVWSQQHYRASIRAVVWEQSRVAMSLIPAYKQGGRPVADLATTLPNGWQSLVDLGSTALAKSSFALYPTSEARVVPLSPVLLVVTEQADDPAYTTPNYTVGYLDVYATVRLSRMLIGTREPLVLAAAPMGISSVSVAIDRPVTPVPTSSQPVSGLTNGDV